MSATVEIQTRKVYNVTAVPIQAVTTRDSVLKASSKQIERRRDDDDDEENSDEEKPSDEVHASTKNTTVNECVFVIKDGEVTLRQVKTGIQDNQNIQILEGLKVGEEVITGPYNAISRLLKNGDKVKVVTREELFANTKE